jgi:hypothetical protein
MATVRGHDLEMLDANELRELLEDTDYYAREQVNRLQVALATATARAAGYALLVQELQAAMEYVRDSVHVQEHGGYVTGSTPADQCYRWVCDVVNRALAADPEARASELLAVQKKSAT